MVEALTPQTVDETGSVESNGQTGCRVDSEDAARRAIGQEFARLMGVIVAIEIEPEKVRRGLDAQGSGALGVPRQPKLPTTSLLTPARSASETQTSARIRTEIHRASLRWASTRLLSRRRRCLGR